MPGIRVVSIPAQHPYVTSVTTAAGITVLPDPRPLGAPAGVWWPPVALDPQWIRAHASTADLLHIHFGTESFTAEHLVECLSAAREAGWPVVFTVHDLEHPQLSDQADYRAQLDVLIPGADALLTLTEGAAAEIRSRWGRTALVVPHPAVVPDAEAPTESTVTPAIRVGMHLKDLRSNIAAVAMVSALCNAIDRLTADGLDVSAELRLHRTVRDDGVRETIRELARHDEHVTLVEHERLDDKELYRLLGGLDVCVLPYQHGTHSGWLEMCWDLGTAVVAPRVGFYAEQHPDGTVVSFEPDELGTTLAEALRAAIDSPLSTRPGSAGRVREVSRRRGLRGSELEALTLAHRALYRELVDAHRTVPELRS
ncbi:hypothetical protein C3B60_06115 [Cryobacterium zongtaii]|nr:hypothetical protein C3B60_06115 [Cryobacterium zongtaii]